MDRIFRKFVHVPCLHIRLHWYYYLLYTARNFKQFTFFNIQVIANNSITNIAVLIWTRCMCMCWFGIIHIKNYIRSVNLILIAFFCPNLKIYSQVLIDYWLKSMFIDTYARTWKHNLVINWSCHHMYSKSAKSIIHNRNTLKGTRNASFSAQLI